MPNALCQRILILESQLQFSNFRANLLINKKQVLIFKGKREPSKYQKEKVKISPTIFLSLPLFIYLSALKIYEKAYASWCHRKTHLKNTYWKISKENSNSAAFTEILMMASSCQDINKIIPFGMHPLEHSR